MSRLRLCLALAVLPLAIPARPAHAQISAAPTLINYQGRLATSSGNPVPDGTYSIRFSLWDAASAGTEKWNQTISGITVKNGTFAVLLNTNTANLYNGNLWLEIKIGSNAAQTPRQQIVSVPYALKANSVPDGSILTAALANDAVTSAKIAANAVTNTELASDALSLNKVSGGALSVSGSRLFVANGGIQRGGTAVATTDLGLYSMNAGNWLRLVSNGAPIQFYTTVAGANATPGNSAMTLDSTGYLGIGTGSPTTNLHINSANQTPVQITGSSNIGTWLNLQNTSAGATTWSFISTGSGNGEGAGNLVFYGANGNAAQLSSTGEFKTKVVIITGGSDVAEPYNVAPAGAVKAIPGYVVAIDEDKVGQMRVVSKAYDATVAGIVSGAGGVNPGITLTQKGTVADGELPVASIGRVWCWCDADTGGAIKAGDLLTSSDTPGHAMKAADKNRRDGAVIGKAMSSLKSGKGLVLVLVSLK